ncbi:hypothetical protein ABZ079_14085 [Streptomyces sp. NPDC006314]|uniref:hypothetical protein n=1 Tax=Streptomyces sp. NPDC006314 TaxID=3154475 RepID=UPI0033A723D3
MASIEVRVHGVGDHGPLSALGSVGLEPSAVQSEGVDTFVAPTTPAHRLLLVNWSRTSRGIAGFLWYLAAPFTLLNVVGYMKPVGRRRDYEWVTYVACGLSTVVVTAWLITVMETVMAYVPGLRDRPGLGMWLVAGVPAVAASLAILMRAYRRPERRIGLRVAWAHAVCSLGLAGLVLWWKPSRLPRQRWPNSLGYGGDAPPPPSAGEPRLDAMLAFVILSTILALVLASLLRNASAAVVTVLVFLVLHATGAILRLAAGWLMLYLQYIGVGLSRSSGLAPESLLLKAPDPGSGRVLVIDLVPVVAVAVIVGFLVAFAVWARVWGWEATVEWQQVCGYRRRVFVHNVVARLPERIRSALVPAFCLYALVAVVTAAVALCASFGGWPLTVALVVTHAAAAAVLVFLVMRGRFGGAQKVYGTVADVAGFWPVRYHPLAGRSYRDEVVGGLRQVLNRHISDRVVVFCHSQGSVLGSWLVANELVPESELTTTSRVAIDLSDTRLPPEENLTLLTCGSPLNSLYRGFFPSYFHDAFFLRITERAGAWANAWRKTDPIATPMPAAVNSAVEEKRIPEPSFTRLNVHSNYWIEGTLTDWIRDRLTPAAEDGGQ